MHNNSLEASPYKSRSRSRTPRSSLPLKSTSSPTAVAVLSLASSPSYSAPPSPCRTHIMLKATLARDDTYTRDVDADYDENHPDLPPFSSSPSQTGPLVMASFNRAHNTLPHTPQRQKSARRIFDTSSPSSRASSPRRATYSPPASTYQQSTRPGPTPPMQRTQTAPAPIRASHSRGHHSVDVNPRIHDAEPSSLPGARRSQEAVLRSRLEGALLSGTRPSQQQSRRSASSSGAARTEWPWGNASSPESPASTASSFTPPSPPCTPPPFNLAVASQLCRSKDGYVSFCDIEGLGEPPATDEDDDQPNSNQEGRWWDSWPWKSRPSGPTAAA